MKSISQKECPSCTRPFLDIPENKGFECCSSCRNECRYLGLVNLARVLEPVLTLPVKAVKTRPDKWGE